LEDLDSLVEHANDAEVACMLRDRFPHPYTHEIGRQFLTTQGAAEPLESFAIDVGGVAIGGIGVHPGGDVMRHSAEIGYWVGRKYWGRGIASAALNAVVDHVFREGRYCRLHAHTFEGNEASQRVLEKAGFVYEGTLRKAVFKRGKFLDAVLYGLVNEEAMTRMDVTG
jgi:RimJ/RimL family protein N-acetyltransferase